MKKTLQHSLLSATLLVGAAMPGVCQAGIDPFIGEIMIFAGNFCPRGYAETNGQLMSIAQNTALFSLLGTTYGGDGRTTFALPNLQGRSAVGEGQGAGLNPVQLGEMVGYESVTLSTSQLPPHTHGASTSVAVATTLKSSSSNGSTDTPVGKVLAKQARTNIYADGPASANMDSSALQSTASATTTVAPAGNGQPVATRSPGLGLMHCIATEGVYPSRN